MGMTRYVIMESEDGTEVSTFPKTEENMTHPALVLDVDGRPMKLLHEYEATSWNEAMRLRNEFLGFEPYVPMEAP